MYPKRLQSCARLFWLLSAFLVLPASAATAVELRIGVAPPPPRIEHRPPPRHGQVWIPGYWAWNGHRHIWIGGHWERARHGYRYVEPRWELVGGQWEFRPGYWVPIAPVAVAPAPPPPVYVERGAPPPSAPAPASGDGFWYYCHGQPEGYYPYVKQCPSGWEKVAPQPADAH